MRVSNALPATTVLFIKRLPNFHAQPSIIALNHTSNQLSAQMATIVMQPLMEPIPPQFQCLILVQEPQTMSLTQQSLELPGKNQFTVQLENTAKTELFLIAMKVTFAWRSRLPQHQLMASGVTSANKVTTVQLAPLSRWHVQMALTTLGLEPES